MQHQGFLFSFFSFFCCIAARKVHFRNFLICAYVISCTRSPVKLEIPLNIKHIYGPVMFQYTKPSPWV